MPELQRNSKWRIPGIAADFEMVAHNDHIQPSSHRRTITALFIFRWPMEGREGREDYFLDEFVTENSEWREPACCHE